MEETNDAPSRPTSRDESDTGSVIHFDDADEVEPAEPRPNGGMSSPFKKKTRLSISPRSSISRRGSPASDKLDQTGTVRLTEGLGLTYAADQTIGEKSVEQLQRETMEGLQETIRFNEGLTIAVDSWANDKGKAPEKKSMLDDTLNIDTDFDFDEGMSRVYDGDKIDRVSSNESRNDMPLDYDPNDDTCLSTFSAIPNTDMTQFAGLRGSPTKNMTIKDLRSPGKKARDETYNTISQTPNTIKRSQSARNNNYGYDSSPMGSPTPRRNRAGTAARATEREDTNLIDFTGQFNAFVNPSSARPFASPSRARRERASMSPSKAELRTPARGGFALLDFDIPPAPTPRSIPTVTARELESLKSGFLSEISSLKATLSGKEAESASLKSAVSDAERRVGEALEEVRDLKAAKESLEIDKKQWDEWHTELDKKLKTISEQHKLSERERAVQVLKLEESERKREKSDARIVELQNLLESARAQVASATPPSTSDGSDSTKANSAASGARDTDKEVNDAVEKVARELHTLYKGKHEKKVAALKKSYESRWEKRVTDLERQLADAKVEAERLQTEHTHSHRGLGEDVGEMTMLNNEFEAERRVLEARIAGLESELASLKVDSEGLRQQLEVERAEKGELVATVDEWIGLQELAGQQQSADGQACNISEQELKSIREKAVENEIDSLKRSVGIGARPPGVGINAGLPQPSQRKPPVESRIGRFGAPAGHARGKSGGEAAKGAGASSGFGARSGIMSNIERMGRGGA